MRDFQKALGYDGKSESWLLELLKGISKFSAVPEALFSALDHPETVLYNHPNGAQLSIRTIEIPSVQKILDILINARNDGHLSVGQLKFAKSAALLHNYFSNNDLQAAIEEASGFNFEKAAARTRLHQRLMAKHPNAAFEWARVLPDAFFELLGKLYGLHWNQIRTEPEMGAKTTNDLVFSRLPEDIIRILAATKPKRSYKGSQNLQQSELVQYLSSLQQLAETAGYHRNIFMQLLNRTHPKNNHWPVKDTDFSTLQAIETTTSEFNILLKKGIV
ncbi:hypothetical protein FNO01nite_05260 [Flavobacterium noncentrifugens]|nr:hypothetical protein FNO01nite_05260 [Flavobacterium noncentrifugens]